MATNFPNSLDNGTSLPYPSSSNLTNSPSLASGQDNQNDSLIAIQNKLGITASTPTASNLLIGTGAGTSTWSKLAPAGVIVGTTDSQTLTNKTLTSPTITGAILTNANITTDLIAGFTTNNSGTVFGVPITTGVLQTTNTINGSAIVAGTIRTGQVASATLAKSNIDWSTFALNMKSVLNTSAANLTNISQDLASVGLTLSFTVATACSAFVTVSLGIGSATDFEFQPEIRVDGAVVGKFNPTAALGNTSSRAQVRGFSYTVSLSAGTHTISGGVTLASGTTYVFIIGSGSLSALVLGNVTA